MSKRDDGPVTSTPPAESAADEARNRQGYVSQAGFETIRPNEYRPASTAGASQPLSVILAEDSAMARESLMIYLRRIPGRLAVREVHSAAELFETATETGRIDLFLVNVSLPEFAQAGGLRELCRLRPQSTVVALGCSSDPADVRVAMDAGVAAYLPRTINGAALVDAVSLAINGERFYPAELVMGALKLQASPVFAADSPEGGPANTGLLTQRQMMVLRELAAGKTNKQIARALNIQEITVKVHLQAIFARINVKNRTQAAMHAERAGWFVKPQQAAAVDEAQVN